MKRQILFFFLCVLSISFITAKPADDIDAISSENQSSDENEVDEIPRETINDDNQLIESPVAHANHNNEEPVYSSVASSIIEYLDSNSNESKCRKYLSKKNTSE